MLIDYRAGDTYFFRIVLIKCNFLLKQVNFYRTTPFKAITFCGNIIHSAYVLIKAAKDIRIEIFSPYIFYML